MINKQNFKQVLVKLNFEEKNNVFTKKFNSFDFELKIDFDKEIIIYPECNGLTINERQTCNFKANENFVVFECVNRLLEQGYNPKHIELEPKWQVGHGASGGRADILVKDNSGKALLIIECKTSGAEFFKAWNEAQTKPTQVFSYAQQTKTTKFLALYASDFIDEKVIPNYYLISLNDNEELLENNKKLEGYKDTKTVEDIYKIWSETYKKEYATLGLFEDNKAYDIGKTKFNITDLKIVSSKDIQGKYHEFATILRQHNVSGRENAFDKLVNLFLCKVVDEKSNNNDLQFYWKGVAYDDPFSLQDRLQKLYSEGMEKFLGEKITYIDNSQIDNAFRVFKDKPNATKDVIKDYVRQLKFFTNNDFAFIDIHNEKLFYQNFEVFLKIIKIFQDIKLTGTEENQFLGDMFEGFLDQGVKQSEGQYFTPMPIVKFIIHSLPKKLNPKVIDYACGAGHFLNEYALKNKDSHIVGIEKEYRLSKVAKVSAFMYGNDEMEVIYDDALSNNKRVENASFDVLVANPPYSVKGFLQTLNEEDRQKFELINSVEKKTYSSNNSIECFFIEKAKQLLKDDGVAAIIVPSSILNKGSKIYVNTREIILKYFSIVAIYESGSGTFGKTGTNTVTLFLQKRKTNPTLAKHFENMVNIWFDGDFETNEDNFENTNILKEYCKYIGFDYEEYREFLVGNEYFRSLQETEIFKEYKTSFDKLTSTKKSKDKEKDFLKYVKEIEKDKLYYFALAFNNNREVVIVKSPSGNNEIKKFLGYEWSNSKGNEGIKYLSSVRNENIRSQLEDEEDLDEDDKRVLENINSLNNIETPLYNPKNTDDEAKINTIITKNFENTYFEIPENLTEFVTKSKLIDMLDFKRVSFDKTINLNPKRKVEITTKHSLIKLDDCIFENPKSKIQVGEAKELGNSNYNFFTSGENIYKYNDFLVDGKNIYLSTGGNAVVKFYEGKASYSTDTYSIKSKDENIILTLYLYIFLYSIVEDINNFFFQGVGLKHLQKEKLKNLKIPLPPLNIQQNIVSECEKIDNEVENAKSIIEENKKEIEEIIKNIDSKKEKVENLNILLKRGKSTKYGNSNIQVIKSGQARGYNEFDFKEKFFAIESFILDERKLQKGDLLINSTGVGTAGRVTLFNLEGDFVADSHITIFRPDKNILDSDFALQCFIDIGFKNIEKMAKGATGQIELNLDVIGQIKIPLPPLENQKQIVSKIQKIEEKINEAKKVINKSKSKKEEILKKWL